MLLGRKPINRSAGRCPRPSVVVALGACLQIGGLTVYANGCFLIGSTTRRRGDEGQFRVDLSGLMAASRMAETGRNAGVQGGGGELPCGGGFAAFPIWPVG